MRGGWIAGLSLILTGCVFPQESDTSAAMREKPSIYNVPPRPLAPDFAALEDERKTLVGCQKNRH